MDFMKYFLTAFAALVLVGVLSFLHDGDTDKITSGIALVGLVEVILLRHELEERFDD